MISVGGNTSALTLGTNLPHMTENTYTLELRSALEQEKNIDIVSMHGSWTVLDVIKAEMEF